MHSICKMLFSKINKVKEHPGAASYRPRYDREGCSLIESKPATNFARKVQPNIYHMRSRQSFADTLRKGRKRNLSANQKRAFPRQPCETVQKTSSTCRVAIVLGTSESAEKSNKTQYKNISSYPSSKSAEEGSMLLFQTASVYIFSLQGRSFEYQTETTLIISSGQPSTVGEEYERR